MLSDAITPQHHRKGPKKETANRWGRQLKGLQRLLCKQGPLAPLEAMPKKPCVWPTNKPK